MEIGESDYLTALQKGSTNVKPTPPKKDKAEVKTIAKYDGDNAVVDIDGYKYRVTPNDLSKAEIVDKYNSIAKQYGKSNAIKWIKINSTLERVEDKPTPPKKRVSAVQKYEKLIGSIEDKGRSLYRELGRGFYNSNSEPTYTREGGIEFEYRDSGEYFRDRYGEEDDDFPDFVGGKKIEKIMNKVFGDIKKDVDISVEPGEKGWLYFNITPKHVPASKKK